MANQLKVGSIKPVLAPGYLAFFPCFQAAADTQVTDQSGKGINPAFGADLTGSVAWSTLVNYFSTTPEDVSGTKAIGANFSAGQFVFDPSIESLLVFCKVKAATPAATRCLFGNANGTPNQGFGLKVTSTGKARFDLHRTAADAIINTSSATIADNTVHSVALGIDKALGRVIIWIDGAVDTNFLSGNSIAAYTDWYPFTRLMCMGGAGHNSGKIISMAQSSFGWHWLKRTGGLPSNINDIVARLHQNPVVPLAATEWV